MEYRGFKIRNFKGIKEVEISFNREPAINIFTLVGLNESGKTTILEAINFFSQDDSKDTHRFIPKAKRHNFNEAIEVEAHIALTDEDKGGLARFMKETRSYEVVADLDDFRIRKSHSFKDSLASGSTVTWQGNFRIRTSKKQKEKTIDLAAEENADIREYLKKQLPVIIYYPNFLFDIPEKIYLEEKSEPATTPDAVQKEKTKEETAQPFYMRVIQDVLDHMREGLTIATHIIQRYKSKSSSIEAKEALESQLLKMSSRMNQVIFKAWTKIFPKSKTKEVELQIADDNGRSYFQMSIKEGSNRFQIGERSLGFRWFFTFLLFTEFRKVRQDDPGETIFLLDEPAYNLHSTAQKVLLNVFLQLADRSKLIYTTHSHYLIDPEWLAGAYIIVNKAMDYENEVDFAESSTDIEAIPYRQFVASHPDQTTYFQPILDALDYQPSKLEAVPNLTIFEGKFDYYCMRYLNEVILNGQHQLHAYPGSGDDLLRVIRLYLAWGSKFIVLLDGDTAGSKAKQRYEKELGPLANDLIFTLADVNPKWAGKTTEELFSDHEQLKIIQTSRPDATKYNKKQFNNAIEQLFIAKASIHLCKTTLDNFEQLFSFIAKKQI